jgi:D-lactate dehydrogenase (cytochrome)
MSDPAASAHEDRSLRPLAGVRPDAIDALSQSFGDRFSQSEAIRKQHSGLEGHHPIALPEAVIWVESSEEVSFVCAWCASNGVPLIAQGAGTSLEGHLSAVTGGISVNLSRMNQILDVSADNLLCTVQAGVTREELNQHLRDQGLFFPIDPGANATLGGMASTRASGTNAVRYGTMRNNVLSVKVVLADGRMLETGTKAAKSSAGYDLTALMVGSEGTLGIITQVTLRLYGIPETIIAGTCAFETLDGAVRSTIEAIQIGLPVARIELLDAQQVMASNAYSRLSLPERPTLFLEFHGSGSSVYDQVELFSTIAAGNGGAQLVVAHQAEDRSTLWKARHQAYFAAKGLRPDARVWTSDVCVPIAALAESITSTRARIDEAGLEATIVGHVGDGNYHVMFVLDPDRPEDYARVAEINDAMVDQAIALGGTCTGEHGIGIGKREKLVQERGQDAVDIMRGLKATLDPRNILNPEKIFVTEPYED